MPNSFGYKTICFEKCGNEEGDIVCIAANDGEKRTYKTKQSEWTDYQVRTEHDRTPQTRSSKPSPADDNDGKTLILSLAGLRKLYVYPSWDILSKSFTRFIERDLDIYLLYFSLYFLCWEYCTSPAEGYFTSPAASVCSVSAMNGVSHI